MSIQQIVTLTIAIFLTTNAEEIESRVHCDIASANAGKVVDCDGPGSNPSPVINITHSSLVPELFTCRFELEGTLSVKSCTDGKWVLIERDHGQPFLESSTSRQLQQRRRRGFFDFISAVFSGVSCLMTFGLICPGSQPRVSRPPDHPPRLDCSYLVPIHVTADPFQIHTQVNWTEPVAHDDEDGTIIPRRDGRGPGKHFTGEKQHVIKYVVKDRAGHIASCNLIINVEVIRCPAPIAVPNGYYMCHPSSDHLLGGSCRFGCYDGFDLVGSDTITCLMKRQWDTAQPYCRPFTCPPPPRVDGANMKCTDGWNFRSVCTYHCNQGYGMPRGVSAVILCNRMKQWQSHGQPQCQDSEPPKFTSCPSLVISGTEPNLLTSKIDWPMPSIIDNSNIPIEPMQSKGPKRGTPFNVGTHRIQIDGVDRAGNQARPCEFAAIVRETRCPKLYELPYTKYSCSNGARSGSQCHVTCARGKELEGPASVTCSSESKNLYGSWNWNSPSFCKAGSTCAPLDPPTNGAVVCDNWAGGSFCQLQCRNGTSMNGEDWKQLRMCTGSIWSIHLSGSRNICKVLRHPLQVTTDWTAYFSGHCDDDTTKQQIADNFVQALTHHTFSMEACPDKKDCKAADVTVRCGNEARHRREATADNSTVSTITIGFQLSVRPLHTDSSDSLALRINSLNNDLKIALAKSVSDPTGLALHYGGLTADAVKVRCPNNSVQAQDSLECIDCQEGTFYNNTTGKCDLCIKGQYQDEAAQPACKLCPGTTSTTNNGATSASDCEPTCELGTWSTSGTVPCTLCNVGSYQSSRGGITCASCPASMTTENSGSQFMSDCKEFDITIIGSGSAELQRRNETSVSGFVLTSWMRIEHGGSRDVIAMVDANGVSSAAVQIDGDITVNIDGETLHTGKSVKDGMWHMFSMTYSNCSLAVDVDPHEEAFTAKLQNCSDEISFQSVALGGGGFEGSISQLNLWSLTEYINQPSDSKCFSGSTGDFLAWGEFSESILEHAFINLPSGCDDFNECVSNPCIHGNCSDDLHGFKCTCDSGFTGADCSMNVDDCTVNMCINGATCQDGVNSYTCVCTASFTGRYCEIDMIDGQWGEWGNWSACSNTCGQGSRTRTRLCDSPTPDNGGKECEGESQDVETCNMTYCPVCPEVVAPGNGSIHCSNTSDAIDCTLSCNEGYEFDIEPLPVYQCGSETLYEWNFQTTDNPLRRLPKCSPIVLPDDMTLNYTAYYVDLRCDYKHRETEVTDIVRNKVQNVISALPCISNQSCVVDNIHVLQCDVKSRVRRDAESEHAGFSLEISTDFNSGDASDYLSNLENSLAELQKAAGGGQFTVDVNDDQYHLADTAAVTGHLTCPLGHVRVAYYCVPCGVGSFRVQEGYCKPCNRGEYQDRDAQTSCLPCPFLTTTLGAGSTTSEDCSVHLTTVPQTQSVEVGVIAGSVSAAIIAILVMLTLILIRKYKRHKVCIVNPSHFATPLETISKPVFKFQPQYLSGSKLPGT